MIDPTTSEAQAAMMRASFEAALPGRLTRAERVRFQPFIPSHWFSAAASECISMYINGSFYGAISVSQAYIEALSKFLCSESNIRVGNDFTTRWGKLLAKGVISKPAHDAGLLVYDKSRHDFHHLNRNVEQHYTKLDAKAISCLDAINVIEREIFAVSFSAPGVVSPKNPQYWPMSPDGLGIVHLRNNAS